MATSAAFIDLDEGAAPATPATGKVRIYAKTDGNAYQKDDAGAETGLAGGSGGIAETLLDAKGDLVAAAAADTAARLAAAANGASLITASGESTGLKWRLNNDAASAAPAVTDDSGDGYQVGSRWIDTTNDKEYVCLDASVGAAVWTETTGAGGGGGAPTDATYLTSTANGSLSAEVVVGGAATLERSVQGISDHVVAYDGSASAFRGVPAAFVRGGRQHTVVFDDCFFQATTDIFDGGVRQTVNGTGATTANVAAIAGRAGVLSLSTGTTTTGRCAFGVGNSHVVLGSGKLRFGILAKLVTLSDGTETYTVRMGTNNDFTTDGTDGVYFRYSHGVNGGEWQGVARQASTETALDTNTAADTNWHAFEFEVNAAGTSVEFFIDGVSVGTIASNIPTTASQPINTMPAQINKSAGTTARLLHVDAYWYHYEFTSAR